MNTLLLQEGATHQASTFIAIDKMVEAVGKNASTTVSDAHSIAARGRLITIVCLVLGIVLAIVFGFLLPADHQTAVQGCGPGQSHGRWRSYQNHGC